MNHTASFWGRLVLALGLVLAAMILAAGFKNLRQPGHITVKGLAEVHRQADYAMWSLGVSFWSPSYEEALVTEQRAMVAVRQFLSAEGFQKDAIADQGLVISRYSEDYEDEKGRYRRRNNGFTAKHFLVVRSNDLPKIAAALQRFTQLKATNAELSFEKPRYLLSNLENIKRDLIVQATEDASIRAHKFAETAGAKVGVMRKASQGAFNIYDANDSDRDDAYGGSYDKDAIDKIVRLVVTIDYAIE